MTDTVVTKIYHATHWVLILCILGAAAFGVYIYGNKRYQAGYAYAIKNNPPMTNTFTGNSQLIQNPIPKRHFMGIDIYCWFLEGKVETRK